ncbi:hypothetical protein [Marinifilum flexuosum]|uniref:Lumazine-binding protein n=1 Tax=Marinifilum flexuosum TaxID=1117708 RepID=A0A419X718_9BACT|nr:hypothetical protein [Marinifilum flexuosum]RKE03564.1 hypothetical protein BXY64_0570 [Marinifilum flexuosum]
MKRIFIFLLVSHLCVYSAFSQVNQNSSQITLELFDRINNTEDSITKVIFKKMQIEEVSDEPSNLIKDTHEIFNLINSENNSINDRYLLVQDSIMIQITNKSFSAPDVFNKIEMQSSNKRFVFRPEIDRNHLFLTKRNQQVLNNFIEFINSSIEYKPIWRNGRISKWESPVLFDPLLKKLSNYIPIYIAEGEAAILNYWVIKQVSFNKRKNKALVDVDYTTSGERFYLEKDKGGWKVIKSFTTWIE